MVRALAIGIVLAVIAGVVGWRVRRTSDKVLARIASGATRPIDGRLSRPAADRHRPFAATPGVVALEDLAWLESAGDRHALAEAEILAGQNGRALELLDDPSGDVLVDRAAIELARGHAQAALRLCNHALERAEKLPRRRGPVLWNRALALAALDLPVVAATQLEEVARIGEPGWADEARQRAQALRAKHQSFLDGAARTDSETNKLMREGMIPPEDVTRGWPDMVRMSLYDAIRCAPSPERVRALMPLAQELDGIYGGHVLADRITHIATRNFAVRGPAAAAYHKMLETGAPLAAPELTPLMATLRSTIAGNDDIFLGVEMLLRFPRADASLYAKVARAQQDPWFDALADESDLRIAYADDVTRIEPLSRGAIKHCYDAGLTFRCLRIVNVFVYWLTEAARMTEAEAIARDGRQRAERNDPAAERNLLNALAQIEWRRNDRDLMSAYLDEEVARAPDNCNVVRPAHELKAHLAFRRLEMGVAQRELQAVPERCSPRRYSLLGVTILTSLLHIQGGDAEYAALQQAIRQARQDATPTPTGNVQLDIYEGRALIERDEARGEAMLRAAIVAADARPAADATARLARSDAYVALIVKAAQRERWPQALADVAADQHLAPPPPCTLAVAIDDVRAIAVWRDETGKVAGRLGVRHLPEPDRADVVPDDVVAQLRSCPEVRVLAVPPLHGRSDLLPPDVAWGYGEGRASPSQLEHAPRRLIVTDVRPPDTLELPPLAPHDAPATSDEVVLRGAIATPDRVLGELPDADEALLDVHGVIDLDKSDASMLVLSPDGRGHYALTADAIRKLKLARSPVVALAACEVAHTAAFLFEPWSLPMAFVYAGARGVLASTSPIPDRDADRFFDRVLARIREGETPAIALRNERQKWRTRGQSWTTNVVLFQ